MERYIYAFIPGSGPVCLLALYTTSKCHYFTYNTSLYTREIGENRREERENVTRGKEIRDRGEKDHVLLK